MDWPDPDLFKKGCFPRRSRPLFPKRIMLLCGLILITVNIHTQTCQKRITVESGKQNFLCTEVTVTSDGDVQYGYFFCAPMGPYKLGLTYGGSYTFTFSNPVNGVTLEFYGIDHTNVFGPPTIYEIITLDINGAPYPFPDAGVPTACSGVHAEVEPGGGLWCPPCPTGCHASAKNIDITTPISTLTVTDTYYGGNALGIIFSIRFCCDPCLVKAGLIPSPDLTFCEGTPAIFPPATPNVLPNGTMLQYILFSNPDDTLGSILAISNTPGFDFDPALMQTNVKYYITAVAGIELNGNVDLDNSCKDISDKAVAVTWLPRPSVLLATDNPEICAGNCVTITANFTGTAPYSLTYSFPFLGTATQTFADEVGTFILCPPKTASGPLEVQAVSVSDANCTCN